MQILTDQSKLCNMAIQNQNGSMNDLGRFIQEKRLARGMRSESLASAIGRSQSWVSRVETGMMKTLPEPEALAAIAKALGVTVAELLDAAGYKVTDDPPVVRANPFEQFDLRWHVVEAMRAIDIDYEENEWLLQMMLRQLKSDDDPRSKR